MAELIWDDFMAPNTRARLDEACGGAGRDILRLIAGWHDLGKASPIFQAQVPALAAAVAAVGYPMVETGGTWHHTKAGAVIARDILRQASCRRLGWIIPLIEGHHGRFSSVGTYRTAPRAHGLDRVWKTAQTALAQRVLDDLGITLDSIALGSTRPPALGLQIAVAGFVSMADWIASSSQFPGLGIGNGHTGCKSEGGAEEEVAADPMGWARSRARQAWDRMGLRPGWDPGLLRSDDGLFADRFGVAPRPLQLLTMQQARAMGEPGLMVVEAPMGEGKTEAALAVAEILAHAFGLDGFIFAMPTQGTTDAMYARCVDWAIRVAPEVTVSLLHGKAILNEQWRSQLEGESVTGVDLDDDPYGIAPGDHAQRRFAEWLLGRHRGLLSAGVVGTVDQVLYAGSRTKYVSLRHAGLAGKVVIVDEVHSYDVYMGRFLHTLLAWCGSAGVPVVLMSATLPPLMRDGLISAYQYGSASAGDRAHAGAQTPTDAVVAGDIAGTSEGGTGEGVEGAATRTGYPLVTTVHSAGSPVRAVSVAPRRADLRVRVEVTTGDRARGGQTGGDSRDQGAFLDEVGPIVDRVERELVDGGCALVIVNTVARAQRTYARVLERGLEARLLHGRLTATARADRTAELVDTLGAHRTRDNGRPQRLVVVATQIAEQSFDVDVDVLITDVAPMDLLLQRIGRLHRHDRPAGDRPPGLAHPRVVVTGLILHPGQAPFFCRSFPYVYSSWSLLRAAALLEGEALMWEIPSQVPALVEAAYADGAAAPSGWHQALLEARRDDQASQARRTALAGTFTLDLPGEEDTLAGLHYLDAVTGGDEASVVRDGEPTREVGLVRRTVHGYETLSGRPLGSHGERCEDTRLARLVLGDTVRVRDSERLEGAAPLPAWTDLPLLNRLDVLVVDETGQCETDPRMRYDATLGLLIDRHRRG